MTNIQLISDNTAKAYRTLITSAALDTAHTEACKAFPLPSVPTTADVNEQTRQALLSMNQKGMFVKAFAGLDIKPGDRIFKSRNQWRLFTEIDAYGKEPRITPAQLEKLIKHGAIKPESQDYNVALGSTSIVYVAI